MSVYREQPLEGKLPKLWRDATCLKSSVDRNIMNQIASQRLVQLRNPHAPAIFAVAVLE